LNANLDEKNLCSNKKIKIKNFYNKRKEFFVKKKKIQIKNFYNKRNEFFVNSVIKTGG